MRRSVGIDIGQSQVKMVVLERQTSTYKVLASGSVARGESPQAVAGDIQRFLDAHQARAYPCEVAFSACQWIMRIVELEDRRRLARHLRQIVTQELADDIDHPDDWTVACCPLVRSAGMLSTMAFAALRKELA